VTFVECPSDLNGSCVVVCKAEVLGFHYGRRRNKAARVTVECPSDLNGREGRCACVCVCRYARPDHGRCWARSGAVVTSVECPSDLNGRRGVLVCVCVCVHACVPRCSARRSLSPGKKALAHFRRLNCERMEEEGGCVCACAEAFVPTRSSPARSGA
jgi:hypothetical protein